MIFQSLRVSMSNLLRSPENANGSRIASTMRIRPTVAMPGAMSSRTARATIQFPDHSRSVATRTSQALQRMGSHANLGHAGCESGGALAQLRVDRGRWARKADADFPARRTRLDPPVARLSVEGGGCHRLPRAALRPLRLRPV